MQLVIDYQGPPGLPILVVGGGLKSESVVALERDYQGKLFAQKSEDRCRN